MLDVVVEGVGDKRNGQCEKRFRACLFSACVLLSSCLRVCPGGGVSVTFQFGLRC